MTARPLAVAAMLLLPAIALAGAEGPLRVCIVREEVPAGLEGDAVPAALAVEARKAARALRVVESLAGGCADAGGAVVLRVRRTEAVLQDPCGGTFRLPLDALDPRDRAAEVAHALARLAGPGCGAATVALAEADLTVPEPSPAIAPAPAAPRAVRAWLALDGRYDRHFGPALHGGGLGLEAGASFLSDRLAIVLAGAWLTARQRGDLPYRVDAGDLALVLRGGWDAGPVLLRAGLGCGAEWRRVRVDTPAGTAADTGVAVLGLAEVEVLVEVAGLLRIGPVVGVRWYAGGTRYAVGGRPVYEPPTAVLGAGLRVGVSL